MKLSTMMFASFLALASTWPVADVALAQGGAQEKVRRTANCPQGQSLNAKTRKCEAGTAEATTTTSSTSGQSVATNLDAQQQCIGAGGTWTNGVCITAERQCIDSGGTWTNGVCIKE